MKLIGALLFVLICCGCRSGIREMDLHRNPDHARFGFKSWGSAAHLEGGIKAWSAHLKDRQISLPPQCEEGRVMVSFKVTSTARVDSLYVSKSLCEPADQNVLELIDSAGNWIPAQKEGTAEDSWLTIPIIYHYPKRR